MNRSQVNDFLAEHVKRYPALAKWLSDNRGQREVWLDMLEPVEFGDAIAASRALYLQDDQPRGYGNHPRAIRKLAYQIHGERTRTSEPQRYAGGVPTVSCRRCLDTGIITAMSPATNRALREDDRTHGLRRCALACECHAGDRYTQPPHGIRPLPRWSEGYAIVLEAELCDTPDAWQAARDRLAELDATSHMLPEFAAYAPTQQEF